jgi:Xaa-Pro aminopeptidase
VSLVGPATLTLATLTPMEVGARADRVRAGLDDAGVDALLVTRLPNVRYLTGFTGSAGIVAITADGLVLVTDGRYAEQSRAQLDAAGVAGRAAA